MEPQLPLYQVELINRDRAQIRIAANQLILETIEATGLKLPVGCRYGACITCAARLITGKVTHAKPVALKPHQEALGYVLLCVAIPQSDCQFEVGVESQKALYVNPFQTPSQPTDG